MKLMLSSFTDVPEKPLLGSRGVPLQHARVSSHKGVNGASNVLMRRMITPSPLFVLLFKREVSFLQENLKPVKQFMTFDLFFCS